MTETTKRQKRATSYTGDAVTLDGIAYPLSGFPPETMKALAGAGLVARLIQSDTPQETYADLKSGARTVFREPKDVAGKLDPWREASAIVHAEAVVRSADVRSAPGKKLRDTPEFQAALKTARIITAGWDRQKLLQAKGHARVVAEHQKLTGAPDGLSALFAETAETAEAEPEAELAEAAD